MCTRFRDHPFNRVYLEGGVVQLSPVELTVGYLDHYTSLNDSVVAVCEGNGSIISFGAPSVCTYQAFLLRVVHGPTFALEPKQIASNLAIYREKMLVLQSASLSSKLSFNVLPTLHQEAFFLDPSWFNYGTFPSRILPRAYSFNMGLLQKYDSSVKRALPWLSEKDYFDLLLGIHHDQMRWVDAFGDYHVDAHLANIFVRFVLVGGYNHTMYGWGDFGRSVPVSGNRTECGLSGQYIRAMRLVHGDIREAITARQGQSLSIDFVRVINRFFRREDALLGTPGITATIFFREAIDLLHETITAFYEDDPGQLAALLDHVAPIARFGISTLYGSINDIKAALEILKQQSSSTEAALRQEIVYLNETNAALRQDIVHLYALFNASETRAIKSEARAIESEARAIESEARSIAADVTNAALSRDIARLDEMINQIVSQGSVLIDISGDTKSMQR
jgi:hypothetical protein